MCINHLFLFIQWIRVFTIGNHGKQDSRSLQVGCHGDVGNRSFKGIRPQKDLPVLHVCIDCVNCGLLLLAFAPGVIRSDYVCIQASLSTGALHNTYCPFLSLFRYTALQGHVTKYRCVRCSILCLTLFL